MNNRLIMTKKEIVAVFMASDAVNSAHLNSNDQLHYDESYDWLMGAWRKFRDLKLDKKSGLAGFHQTHAIRIWNKIGYGTITEAFDELVRGIEWYNSIKN